MTSGVYCVTHTATGRKYVGKSKHIEQRMREHKKSSKSKSVKINFFVSALRKYGWGTFAWEILEAVAEDTEKLSESELYWIDRLDVYASSKGFNTRRDSSGVTTFSKEVKKKISDSVKQLPKHPAFVKRSQELRYGDANTFYGKTHSDSTKKKLSAASKQRWQNPEYREKMLGRPRGKGNLGCKMSAEAKEKQSKAKKGRKCSLAHRAKVSVAVTEIWRKRRLTKEVVESKVLATQ